MRACQVCRMTDFSNPNVSSHKMKMNAEVYEDILEQQAETDDQKVVHLKENVRIKKQKSIISRQDDDKLKEVKSGESLAFLFHISDVDVTVNRREKLKFMIKKRLGMLKKMTYSEFELEVKKISNSCLKHMKDLHQLHLRRVEAMNMINDVIARMDVSYVKTYHVVHLVWSVMSCMHHFQLRFRSGTKSLITWTRKKKARECMNTYERLIKILPKSSHRIILNSLIVFYKEGRLWTIEFRLTEMICQLLYLYDDIEEALEDILSTAEQASLNSEVEPRMLMKVLYEILEDLKWDHMSEAMMRRFLVMLRKSILRKPEDFYNYGSMRSGLNICLRNITKNLSNSDLMSLMVIIVKKITLREMEDEILLEFGSIAEYSALRYHTAIYTESIPEELMDNLLLMMASDNFYHNIFSSRILQNIMDRHNNVLQFENPRIFFRGVKYNIRISRYSARDRLYYKKHRLHIYRVLMAGLQHHYERTITFLNVNIKDVRDHLQTITPHIEALTALTGTKMNLENMFTTLAITCVEIPCSYVATSIVSFAMAMQEFILQSNPPNMVSCHHVHSVVMSLMSLVCYVHKAEVFYDYVAQIMERRSDLAPHLNPPIKAVYNYAQHHILWNKPDLFFEDWEARYGLWKCFRTVAQKKRKSEFEREVVI